MGHSAALRTTGGFLDLRFVRTYASAAVIASLALALAGCVEKAQIDPRVSVAAAAPEPIVNVEEGAPVPKGGGRALAGEPYTVAGKTFSPTANPEGYEEIGLASWYGEAFHGRMTSNGEAFDMASISAAHPTLPLPSYARVTNLNNGRSVVVRVNDRGPFHGNRVVDVSQRAAELLDFKRKGMARVKIDYVGPASLKGSDDALLLASYRDKNSPDSASQLAAFRGNAPLPVLTAAADPVLVPSPSFLPSAKAPPPPAYALSSTSAPVAAPAPAKAPVPAAVPAAANATAAATPATTTPAPAAATTPSDKIASRIDAGFGSLRGSQPLGNGGTMVSPVLSGFAFSPMALSGQR